ncbi:MAG: hypothetical protein OEY79_04215, partial [Anaplasmataceae bacterium]|nr:hypothetical protein [Anaplasmataceae bacterium]
EENNTNNEIYKALIDCKYLAKNINKINKLLINQNMSHNNTIYSLITIIKECNKKYKLLHPSKLEQEIVRYNFIQNNNMNLEDYFYDFMYNLCKNNSYIKKILQNIEYYKEIHSNNMLINELKKLFD